MAVLSVTGCVLFRSPVPAEPCKRASTDGEVFLALYSIFYHVEAKVSGVRRPGWKPVGLRRATRWLRCDPDPERRPGRIRHAAVKLGAGVVAVQRLPRRASAAPILSMALEDLIGRTTLVKQLAESSASDVPTLENEAGAIIDAAEGDPSLTALQRTCCPCIDDCVVGPGTNETIAEFTVKVNRAPQCLFHVIDPLCWPSVVPAYVKETFVLDNAPCVTGVPQCRSSKICDPGLTSPQPVPVSPTAGTPWCGLLFERVETHASGVTSEFVNVLEVETKYDSPSMPTPTAFRMDYGLCESRSWKMCDSAGCQTGDCPLLRDCGFARADETGVPGWARVDGAKRIHFTSGLPYDANLWAPLALEVLVKETANALCVSAAQCPRAAKPTGCPVLPGPENCSCPKDACVQKHFVSPIKATPFCP